MKSPFRGFSSSCSLAVGLLFKGQDVIARCTGQLGGLENGLLVLLEHIKPRFKIAGVILQRLMHVPDFCGHEAGTQLGNQLFKGIVFAAEFVLQLTLKARACPVNNRRRSRKNQFKRVWSKQM